MSIVDAVYNTSGVGWFRQTVVQVCVGADDNVLYGTSSASEIPDLYTAITARRGEDATRSAPWLEANLFQRSRVVTQNRDGRLRHHVDDLAGLVTRGRGEQGIVLAEVKVNNGVAVCMKRQMDLGELLFGVEQSHISFFVANGN